MDKLMRPPLTCKTPGLFETMRKMMRRAHMSLQTEKNYLHWVKRFWYFHKRRHPREMGQKEITEFLNHLASILNVAASTQNQALCAIVFLYKKVLGIDPGQFQGLIWAKKPKHMPVVLSVPEIQALLSKLTGVQALIGCMLYGTGMRLAECLSLRVKDVDFERNLITIRDAKGEKDRTVPLPLSIKQPLHRHLEKVRILHDQDTKAGFGRVYLPYALERKYPNANAQWCWKYVFPSVKLSKDPRSGQIRRHHLYGNVMQMAVAKAMRLSEISKKVTCHTFRHSYATQLAEDTSK